MGQIVEGQEKIYSEQDWEQAKEGLKDVSVEYCIRDEFFPHLKSLGFKDPYLVRSMYKILEPEPQSLQMYLAYTRTSDSGVTQDMIIDTYVRRIKEYNRKFPNHTLDKQFPDEVGRIYQEWNLRHKLDFDYVPLIMPWDRDPWKEAKEGLPEAVGDVTVDEFFNMAQDLGFKKEEDIPAVRSLYLLSSKHEEKLHIAANLKKDAYTNRVDLLDKTLAEFEKPENKELFSTDGADVQAVYDNYNDLGLGRERKPIYEVDAKTGLVQSAEMMQQVKGLEEHMGKVLPYHPEIRDLDRKTQFLLYGKNDLEELGRMFDTKKTLRFFQGGDSDEYKKANSAMKEYLAQLSYTRQTLKSSLDSFNKGLIMEEGHQDNVKNTLAALKEAEEKLRKAMMTYAVKVTNGDQKKGILGEKKIENMTATGAARLAGAMCILDTLDTGDVLNGAERKSYGKVRDEERVKETSFAEIYNTEFKGISKEKNRHRRAAAATQQNMKEQEAERKAVEKKAAEL